MHFTVFQRKEYHQITSCFLSTGSNLSNEKLSLFGTSLNFDSIHSETETEPFMLFV